MKTLKAFEIASFEPTYGIFVGGIEQAENQENQYTWVSTIEEAYDWLEQNSYITREDERIKK